MSPARSRSRRWTRTLWLVSALCLLGFARGATASCPCLAGVDNFCSYGPSYPGCSMTSPGGYCDPNGDGSFSDADWERGYYDFQAACSAGPSLPDVYIQDLWWEPANPSPGQQVQFHVRIHNQGNAATGQDVGVGYFVNGQFVGWGIRGPMGAGETSSNFGMHQRWTASGGTFTVRAHADDINRFLESNENNNVREETITVGGIARPDVYIQDLWWTPSQPSPGQQVQFHAHVHNQGNAGTGADVGIGYFVNGQFVGWGIRGPMAAGEHSSTFGMHQRWTAQSGTFTVKGHVDDINRFLESNENNNVREEPMTLGGTALPDVYIQDLWWTPSSPAAGDQVQFHVRVHNQGNAGTGADVGVGYFVNGGFVGWGIRGPMSAGETSSSFGMHQRWSAGSGSFTVRAFVDDINRFGESNENNNIIEEPMTVSGGGGCGTVYDMREYLIGDPGVRVYSRLRNPDGHTFDEEFAYRDGGTSHGLNRWYFVKNPGGENWEEFGFNSNYVYRYRDTSWANTCQDGAAAFYQTTDSDRTGFARWVPRFMAVCSTFVSPVSHFVDAGYKRTNNCSTQACTSVYEGWVTNRLKLVAHHDTYTTIWGLQVSDVLELTGIDGAGNPIGDRFFYARDRGLVGFHGPAGGDIGTFSSGAYAISGGNGTPNWQALCTP